MRALFPIAAAAVLSALAGCATTDGPSHYARELARLSESCDGRGGILVSNGLQTGRPQTEYVCQISGGASRVTLGD